MYLLPTLPLHDRAIAADRAPARPLRIPALVSRRISVARIVMITGIVILHVPPHVPLSETPADLFSFVKAFLSQALFRSTVPLLTFISGYLLFAKYPTAPIRPILRGKTRTILLPMLIFNVPFVVALYFVQQYRLIDHHFGAQLVPFDLSRFLNGCLGYTAPPVNYPLNFLRDLFVVSLLAPLFAIPLRHAPLIGLCACSVVFWFNLDGPLVLRKTMPINFYLGALASVYGLDVNRLDRYRLPALLLLVGGCASIVAFRIEDRSSFRLASPFVLWPVLSYLSTGRAGALLARLAPGSFFIFLTHAPILLATWFAYRRLGQHVSYPAYWTVAPFATVAIAFWLRALLNGAFPRAMKVALGGRS